MRATVYLALLFVFVVIDVSLRNVLALGGIAPMFTPILVVFVALFAPRFTALWSAWGAGLLIDLLTDLPHGAHEVGPILGPHALGYVFGAFVVLQARPMLLRRHVLTLVAMTLVFIVAVGLVTIFIYAAHGWYERSMPLFWSDSGPLSELWRRVLGALYSSVIALVLAPFLLLTSPVWSFRTSVHGGSSRW